MRFWPDNKTLEQICKEISSIDLKPTLHRRTIRQEHEALDFTEINECSEWEQLEEEKDLVNLVIQYLETSNVVVEEVYMTEIQLRRIVDRTAKEQQAHQSDGDETMTKDGKMISKFSKEAMNIGEEAMEHEVILRKVYLVYDKWVGNDSVFPVSNGAPKIMTKFKDTPYSHELGRKDSHMFSHKGIRQGHTGSRAMHAATIVHFTAGHSPKVRTRSRKERSRSRIPSLRERLGQQTSQALWKHHTARD